MSNEILMVLEYMEKEKGISRPEMIETIVSAIRGAAIRSINAGQDVDVQIDPKTGKLEAWMVFQIVDSVGDPLHEIHVEKARETQPEVKVGDVHKEPIDPALLGRIAAQTARQAISHRVRQFEKDRIYDDFKDSVGDIVSGVVRRRVRRDLLVDLGHVEALLPEREQSPSEDYSPSDRIRCLLLKIQSTLRGPEIILSRASPHFVRRLFEIEVSEINDSTVVIETIAREPGYRSKIAVRSRDSKIDPVGACVGTRGMRVKNVVRELGGEKVDIIRWDPDPIKLLEEAIKPAGIHKVEMREEDKTIYFEVSEEDIAIAIGRRGQNAKLTSKLLGWRLDIGKLKTEKKGFADKRQEAVETLSERLGISIEKSTILVDSGLSSIEAFEGVQASDLVDMSLSEEEATLAIERIKTLTQR